MFASISVFIESLVGFKIINNSLISSVVKQIAIGAGGLGFDSRAGQNLNLQANPAMFSLSCVIQALSGGDAQPVTRLSVIPRV